MICRQLGKLCYLTPHSANVALEAMNAKKTRSRKSTVAGWHSGKAEVYHCEHCHAWHIGHSTPRGRLKKP